VEASLAQQAAAQVEELLPSLLVPEQRAGVPVLLERYKELERLREARVLEKLGDLPEEYSACRSGTVCLSADGKRIASLTPIGDADHALGYLLKVSAMPNPLADDALLQTIEITLGVVLLTFLCIF